jgi:hypothetical protein
MLVVSALKKFFSAKEKEQIDQLKKELAVAKEERDLALNGLVVLWVKHTKEVALLTEQLNATIWPIVFMKQYAERIVVLNKELFDVEKNRTDLLELAILRARG